MSKIWRRKENMEAENEGMLSPYRVLDLTNERGLTGGRILGDLGADVIKVERPGGDPARRLGPFYLDIPDPERSLHWMGFNTNKRGITLDIETADGREIFKRLCKTADIIIESHDPGYMESIGLGYESLKEVNPGIIMASITGFGQSGPYRDYKAPDIVLWALSGLGYVTGDADRAPLSASFPVSYFFSALQAVIGSMIALYQRGVTGKGQYIDAVTLLGLAWTTGPEVQGLWPVNGQIVKRSGRIWPRPQTSATGEVKYIDVPLTYPCKDGGVKFFPFVEPGMLPSTNGLTQWVIEEGAESDTLINLDWSTFNWQTVSQETADEIVESFSRLFIKHTKAELWKGAQERGIQLYPVFTPKDMLSFPQLDAREYWEKVEHPELGTTITYPGAFAKLAEGSCSIRRRAPLIGEHNADIYINELGMSKGDLITLKQANVI
ncbi:CaiB/BaiF CoA transferase family protein [Chloroflexota bacterium]